MPLYIHGLLSAYPPTIALRFSVQSRLAVGLPTTSNSTVLTSMTFQIYAPQIWNDVHQYLRSLVRISGAQRAFDVTISHWEDINIRSSQIKILLFI